MYLVAIGWMYVVLMMAVAEAISPQGSVLGALITFFFYGVFPTLVLMYIMGTPARRRARKAQEAAEAAALQVSSAADGDGSGQAAGEPIAAERKEA
jgi:mannose/fructose/N-acetylgalactosamine-specific phosphotransferase system component IID